jgi:hypothetical protein
MAFIAIGLAQPDAHEAALKIEDRQQYWAPVHSAVSNTCAILFRTGRFQEKLRYEAVG